MAEGIAEVSSVYSQLQPFTVTGVEFTGVELGRGAYGSVQEVKLAGALCAAKQIHEFEELLQASEMDAILKLFVSECMLLSSLRHPNIVQFFGVCIVKSRNVPALLMEKLKQCLHSKLESQPNISLVEKHSILLDASRGLAYLHSRDPPVIHRDLTARNILLASDGIAKIADLGVARLLDLKVGKQMKTMTNAPGNIAYMPPEALEIGCKYNASIDVFSFGNLALYTLTQVFPQLLAPTYPHPKKNKVVARTEIERRSSNFEVLHESLGDKHPFVKLIACCLQNQPKYRPSASDIMKTLEKANIQEDNSELWAMTKQELILNIDSREQSLERLANELNAQTTHIKSQEEKMEKLEDRICEVEAEKAKLVAQAAAPRIQRSYSLDLYSTMPLPESERVLFPVNGLETSPLSPPSSLLMGVEESLEVADESTADQADIRFPCSIKWREVPAFPSLCSGVIEESVTIGESVFIRFGRNELLEFTPNQNLWKKLPSPDVKKFKMVEVQGQLVVVEDADYFQVHPNKLFLWDKSQESWVEPYPLSRFPRVEYSVISYDRYLLLISGNTTNPNKKSIEILDTSTSVWYTLADSIPAASLILGSKALRIGNNLVISHFSVIPQMQPTKKCFIVNLPELISHLHTNTDKKKSGKLMKLWKPLCDLPHYNMSLATVGGTLLAMGGITGLFVTKVNKKIYMYNPEMENWLAISINPKTFSHAFFGMMPSGDLLFTSKSQSSQSVHVGTLSCSL